MSGSKSAFAPALSPLPDRVLIVDDDPFVRTVVAAVLKEAGVTRVKACASGEEALGMAADFRPHLVLLDYVMPGLNGGAVWEALRARLEPPPLVVFMTARPQAEVESEVGAYGVLGVIAKPFNPLMLADGLRGMLGQRVSSSSNQSGFERLAVISAEYRRSLNPAADLLAAGLAEVQREGWRRERGEVLLAKAHNLAGSAGLFGLHDVGAAAEAVERLLSQALKREVGPDVHEVRKIEGAVLALMAACRK